MSVVVGWVLVGVAVVLFVIAYVRYRAVRDELLMPKATEPKGAEGRRVTSAVYSGTVPVDREWAAATRALARRTVHNFPLRRKYALFGYLGAQVLAISLYAFLPTRAIVAVVGVVVIAAVLVAQAVVARRGAERILATKK